MGGKSYKLYETLKGCIWIAVTIIKANNEGSKLKGKGKNSKRSLRVKKVDSILVNF